MSVFALPELQKLSFISADQLRPPEGVVTGVSQLDRYLLWQGLPKGELTLLEGAPGTGATSLCLEATRKAHQQNKLTAWIQDDTQLLPSHLVHRGVNLEKLFVIQKPEENPQFFWILQELITSSLFEVITCEIKDFFFKAHQIMKLKKLARFHKVALILVTAKPLNRLHSFFSLVIRFQRDFITILRALHRPTPFHFSGSALYENFMPQFKKVTKQLSR